MYNNDDLAQIESAILKLQSDERVVSVAYGDHAVKYAEVDLQELISLRNKIRAELKTTSNSSKRSIVFATQKGVSK
jgi:hypothetical protein